VVAAGPVEAASTGDQAQDRPAGVVPDARRWQRPLGLPLDPLDHERPGPSPARPTTIRLPRRSRPSRKNTAGPRRESTWPTITAGPAAPGRGPGSYHPARSTAGTSLDRSWPRPTGTTRASTPIAGIRIDTGRPLPAVAVAQVDGTGSMGWAAPPDPPQAVATSRRHPASRAPQPQAANLGLRRREPGCREVTGCSRSRSAGGGR